MAGQHFTALPTELSNNAVIFADQVVQIFTQHIGDWAYLLIAISAFATMFSTCMTAHDAVARVSLDCIALLRDKKISTTKNYFTIAIIILAVVNFMVVSFFRSNMGQLIALATFVSFVVAPVVGYMNLKNVVSEEIPEADRPQPWLRTLTYLGIIFLSLFSVFYLWMVLL